MYSNDCTIREYWCTIAKIIYVKSAVIETTEFTTLLVS